MERRPAKTLEPGDVRLLTRHVGRQRYPERNAVIVLLSFKAGLRACEIGGLDWSMVLDSHGRVSPQLTIAKGIAKKGLGADNPCSQRASASADLAPPQRRKT